MAVVARVRSIAAVNFRWDIELDGTIDGVNTSFLIPASEKFVQSGNIKIRAYLNGQRLLDGASNDYVVSESGGLGTGFDTVELAVAPEPGDKVTADFVVDI